MFIRFLSILVFLTLFNSISGQDNSSLSTGAESQSDNSKNAAYVELLGKGGIYSINFEREVYRINEEIAFNASIGFSLMNGYTDVEKSKDFLLPLEINVKYSFDKHHVVLGYGTTLWKYKVIDVKIDNSNIGDSPAAPTLKPMKEWFAHLTLEYRYQKPEGGLLIKAGITPLWFDYMSYSAFSKNANFQMWPNLGVGWAF